MPHPHTESWLRAALGGRFDPFPWQHRLLEQLLDGPPPRALDLPTGLGKTSVIALWLVARAAGAHHLPRRLVYVVDRRAVVDQASRVAEGLHDLVEADPLLKQALRLTTPLPVSTLRGQHVDNRAWLADPTVPAIIVGTVDMVGSRLLFEGYACSRKMRPIHAGLLGCDTLFVLDEAHLVPAFEHLLDGVQHGELWPAPPAQLAPPLQILALSATGRGYDRPFQLEDADRAHPVVQQRIHARKRVRWVDLAPKDKLHEALAAQAWALATQAERPQRILVFSNRRDDADKALQHLEKLARADRGRRADLPATELLVGARRIRERSAAERRLQTLGFVAGDAREPLVDHAFLFTTSAGEVGVDLDADHAVADVVAWERMVQRLGRVNRRGEGDADVIILAHPDNDWVERLHPLVQALPTDSAGVPQAGPDALATLDAQHADAVRAARTPEPLHPPLSLPLVEAWAMTSLLEHTGRPEVAPWLRGWVDDDPQTGLVWRTFLPPSDVDAYFETAPPHLSEAVEVPTYRVVSWLVARALAMTRADPPPLEDHAVAAMVLDRTGTHEQTLSLADLAALDKRSAGQLVGRTVVVDRRLAGLSPGGLLDDKADTLPPTVEDADWMPDLDGAPVVGWRARVRPAGDPDPEAPWVEALRIPWQVDGDETAAWLVVELWPRQITSEESRSASHPQRLDEHHTWTAEEAARIGSALGLPDRLQAALVVAARLHDEGKRAPRWQRAFSAPEGGPWAKTRGPVRVRLLDGYRHELGSLPHAQASAELQELPEEDQDLVLHLIAAHHGSARPTIRTTGCDDAPPSRVEGRAREVALRFARLQARWGPWRLAWLETLLRAADQTASRRNDARRG